MNYCNKYKRFSVLSRYLNKKSGTSQSRSLPYQPFGLVIRNYPFRK